MEIEWSLYVCPHKWRIHAQAGNRLISWLIWGYGEFNIRRPRQKFYGRVNDNERERGKGRQKKERERRKTEWWLLRGRQKRSNDTLKWYTDSKCYCLITLHYKSAEVGYIRHGTRIRAASVTRRDTHERINARRHTPILSATHTHVFFCHWILHCYTGINKFVADDHLFLKFFPTLGNFRL